MLLRKTIFFLCLTMLLEPASGAAEADPQWRVFRYRMAGRVRLLLFWVGREDVGGGTIALLKNHTADGKQAEAVEVLFGSSPNRVPGKINRWGYGRESSEWQDSSPGQPILLSSTFEGFMRHSDEESLSEVRSRTAEDTFWYDGIQSRVTPEGATSVVHIFSERKDFDYTQPGGVECGYRRRLKAGPPDRSRQLKKAEFPYSQPYGFLTAVKYLVGQVSDRFTGKSPKWAEYRPELSYVYNAKPYKIAISDLEHHREYLPAAGWQVKDVIEAEFRVTNLKTREKHNFSLWFPATGPLQNIPLKIVDKPRWWLRVELTLDPASGKQGGIARSSGAMPACGEGG